MKRPAWIGADPGASGAIALYLPPAPGPLTAAVKATRTESPAAVEVFDMPQLKDGGGLDHWTLAAYLRGWAITYDVQGVTVERVSAMPGQGVTSMFSFGSSFGAIKQAIASAGLHFTLVSPVTWKLLYGLRGGRENKAASAVKAIELFPGLEKRLYGPKGGVKDGRAEAVLLAHYGSKLRSSRDA